MGFSVVSACQYTFQWHVEGELSAIVDLNLDWEPEDYGVPGDRFHKEAAVGHILATLSIFPRALSMGISGTLQV